MKSTLSRVRADISGIRKERNRYRRANNRPPIFRGLIVSPGSNILGEWTVPRDILKVSMYHDTRWHMLRYLASVMHAWMRANWYLIADPS